MTGKAEARADRAGSRDQVHVDLLGQSALLRKYAEMHGMAVSLAIRTAISRMLQAEAGPWVDADEAACTDVTSARDKTRVLLSFSSSQCTRLASRAAASGLSRSQYVMALMEGESIPPAGRHEAMVAALTASTAGMATQWVDLRRFLRLQAQQASAELAPLLAALRDLPGQLHEHLVLASSVLAELEKSRRYRR